MFSGSELFVISLQSQDDDVSVIVGDDHNFATITRDHDDVSKMSMNLL